MNVTVEISGILAAVRKYNPNADLTGLKAYLLDMALAEGGHDEVAPARYVQPAPTDAAAPVAPAAPAAAEKSALLELPAGVIGAPVERTKPRVMVNRALRPSPEVQSEKERKRKELEKFVSMDSKTLLEQLTPGGRRNEHNQVTDEGMDSATGGDLEIG